jgi:hypothetical protein
MLSIILTKTKKMKKLKHINNLEQLRAAKRDLKLKMAREDREAQDGFLYSTVNKLFSKVENNASSQSTPVGNGVHSALNFLSNQAQTRFNLGSTAKSLISIGVVIAAPIIARKLQELIDKRL